MKEKTIKIVESALGHCIQHKAFDAEKLNRMHEILVKLRKGKLSICDVE